MKHGGSFRYVHVDQRVICAMQYDSDGISEYIISEGSNITVPTLVGKKTVLLSIL